MRNSRPRLQRLSRLDLSHNHIDTTPQLGCLVNLLGLRELSLQAQQLQGPGTLDTGTAIAAAIAALPQVRALRNKKMQVNGQAEQ